VRRADFSTGLKERDHLCDQFAAAVIIIGMLWFTFLIGKVFLHVYSIYLCMDNII